MTAKLSRFVFDTNVLVAAGIRHGSTPAEALRKALRSGVLMYSEETWAELRSVMMRGKFDSYQPASRRERFLESIYRASKIVDSVIVLQGCRDPQDDKFLSLAVSGKADAIITGDKDLLALHPFRGIAIITPAEYLAQSI